MAGKAKGKGYRTLNVKFDKIKSDIQTFCSLKEAGGIPITFDLIDNFLSGKNDNDFYQLYDDIVSKKNLRVSTKYKYTLLRQRLKNFKSRLFTSDITYEFIKSFDSYLRKDGLKDGGALYNMHKSLKSVLNEAFLLDKIESSPYKRFKFKGAKRCETFLEEKEVVRIKDLIFDENDEKKYKLSKDMFLFACYTGLRFCDCDELLVSNIDLKNSILLIVMKKTNEILKVPFNSQAKTILCKYMVGKNKDQKIFPKIANQTINLKLKDIANMAKIDKRVHFHIGRHTFASNLVNRCNVPITIVSKLLGHVNISNTMIYTNSNFAVLQNAMKDFRYGIKS
ncbi:tyrosine-type recombinase/integrase [Chryseobacterium gambrini]|uniref:Site-specific recombinase XerD n=1 Tax=Chryseobacterium gambrini TaxID=373672 RepID=A0A1N7NZ61_9FLAO|nr:site-specific integrase [Chryseobacterium gambrini]SIT03612.1 Site-specific recombinase XerD [Chryseobacterium gambrini]